MNTQAINVNNAESGEPAPNSGHSRLQRLQRWSTWTLIGGLLAVVVWAALAPLDEGVPTQALVALDTKRKTIQHQQGGIIREVLVREGDVVKEDQVLIRLEDGVVRANMEATRQRYLGLRAMESRLLAEQFDRDRIDFHPDVTAEARDPLIQRHMATQEQLWRTRRAALHADLSAIEESILGQEAMRQSYAGMIEGRRTQQRVVQEQFTNIRELVREGYAPRNQQLDLERQMAEINTALTDLQGNLARTAQVVAELRQRVQSRRQEYRKESDAQLTEVTREVQSDEGRLRALREELARTEIRSPSAGQVVGLSFQTVGGVIPPGQRVMDVVPQGEPLLLEARILPHLIDAVRPGLMTDVRFSAFAHSPHLVAEGRVVSVSGDLLTEQTPMGMVSFFLARVELTPAGMKTLGRHQIQPGMPAEVIVKTGERTVLTYLLHPLTRRVAASMKEQ
jgi:protease secretion system membrane fusion protein